MCSCLQPKNFHIKNPFHFIAYLPRADSLNRLIARIEFNAFIPTLPIWPLCKSASNESLGKVAEAATETSMPEKRCPK